MAGNFIEQIKRARDAAGAPPEEKASKPIEQMTDAELEEAITAARLAAASRGRSATLPASAGARW